MKCPRCNGSGEVTCDSIYGCEDPDDGYLTCLDCHGTGSVAAPLRVEDLLDGLPCALTGQDCVDRRHVHLTNAPRLSTEDEVREIVDGKLVKMREIGRWGYDTETGEEGKP